MLRSISLTLSVLLSENTSLLDVQLRSSNRVGRSDGGIGVEYIVFDIIACLVLSPPFTLPHFNDSEAFFSFTAGSQFIELSLVTITFNILLSEGRSILLTGMKMMKAAQRFKSSVPMRTKTMNTEAVNFFLFASCIINLDFAIWPCSLKIGHDHIFKPTGLVFSKCEPTCL